ncbi:hypothetical protein OC846_001638 [Tilletia horrida]|uniref:Uncharacterized protein n=1 Tax=Tilletia horrida TaxID=155126 RepID=A0AAN6GTS0_9BASI|nr:hypothetical protein OC845_003022 [Tilletia horrida]KAK0555673.1 hypothetical protein OC846_001638 [Tilletia horrida]KAK0568575.1 hypothetical protein OC861_001823 [Tilletia horrida]
MSLRDIPVRYHHSHKLSSGSTNSTGANSSSGESDASTPPSSAQSHHSKNPFRNRSKRPSTSAETTIRKSPPNSPPGSGFFRHKFHGDSQTSSSSVGSSTLVSVELSRIESAAATPTQSTFPIVPSQQPAHQSWFARHNRRKQEEDTHTVAGDGHGHNDDADSEASFGCGLASEFDRHVELVRADPLQTALTSTKEPIMAAAWRAKMSQADERQAWLDTVFFQLKARAEGVFAEEPQNVPVIGKGRPGAYEHRQYGAGKYQTLPAYQPKTCNMDKFLDLSNLINPCPPAGVPYVPKYAKERLLAAKTANANQAAKSLRLDAQPLSDFVFPNQPVPGPSGVATSPTSLTPRAPPMQRFASSDQVLMRGRAQSSTALRQTALANAATHNRLNQVPPAYDAMATIRPSNRAGSKGSLGEMNTVTTRERSVSDASRRSRGQRNGGSGDAQFVEVPNLPDWAKQANQTLHQGRPGMSESSGAYLSGPRTAPLMMAQTSSELPYFDALSSLPEPEPMSRAQSHDTRLQPGRPALLSRASSNSLRRMKIPETLRISPTTSQFPRSYGMAGAGPAAYGVDMEVSLSSPGSIMTNTGSTTSSRESFGSATSYSTTGSSPLTPRTPEYQHLPLPIPQAQHHFPGGYLTVGSIKELNESSAVSIVRGNAIREVDLDADDEDALLSGTGKFALAQGPPLAQRLIADHHQRHRLPSRNDFLRPRLLSPTSTTGKVPPLLAPEELVSVAREVEYDGAPVKRSSSARTTMPSNEQERKASAHALQPHARLDVSSAMNRPRANTMATAGLLPPVSAAQRYQ